MKNKILLLVFILIAIIWFAISNQLAKNQTADQPQQKDHDVANLRLEWVHQSQFAGFYAAENQNYFRDSNLKVNLLPGGVDVSAIQSVIGGEEFGLAEGEQILVARSKGAPIVPLITIYRKNPSVFFSLKDSGIATPKDMIGKKVATVPDMIVLLHSTLKGQGVEPDQINQILVEYDITPLLTGEVDVWSGFVIDQVITAKNKGFDVNIIWPTDYGVNFPSMTLFTTEKMISEKPELVNRFVKATLKGWEYAYANPQIAAGYSLNYSDVLDLDFEEKLLIASKDLVKPDDKPMGTMDQSAWKEMQETLMQAGQIETPVDLDAMFALGKPFTPVE